MPSPKNSSPNSAITRPHPRQLPRTSARKIAVRNAARSSLLPFACAPWSRNPPATRKSPPPSTFRAPASSSTPSSIAIPAGCRSPSYFPYSKSPKAIHHEQKGRVVRVTDLGDGLRGVAITFIAAPVEDHSAAREAAQEAAENDIYAPPAPAETAAAKAKKPHGPRGGFRRRSSARA